MERKTSRTPTVTFSNLGKRGQFGNQLFQISAVLGYAAKFGAVARLPQWRCKLSGRDYGAVFPTVTSYYGSCEGALYNESNMMFIEIPFAPRIDLNGNFQSEKYFANVADTVKQLFAEPPAVRGELDRYCAAQGLQEFDALHVRFYSDPSTDHGLGPMEPLPDRYFVRALERLEGGCPLVIATDDKRRLPALLARNNIARQYHMLDFEDSLIDFFMLSRARRIAISNSSFSWWAAYLGRPKDAIIAPQRYYWFDRKERSNPFYNTSTLYPNDFEEQIF